MIVELVGGPLDGQTREMPDTAYVHRERIGGERPLPRWIPAEGQPLMPRTPKRLVEYRRHVEEDARTATFGGPTRFRFYAEDGVRVEVADA